MLRTRLLTIVLIVIILLQNIAASPLAARPADPPTRGPILPTHSQGPLPPTEKSKLPLQQAPLAFEPNMGQHPAPVRFTLRAPGSTVFFTPQEVVFAVALTSTKEAAQVPTPPPSTTQAHPPISKPKNLLSDHQDVPLEAPAVVRLQWLGITTTAELSGSLLLPGRLNYFRGDNPKNWHTNIPTYASLTYTQLYPGVSLVYDNYGSKLKSTYYVAAGADASQIRWHYVGAQRVTTDNQGNLAVTVAGAKAANQPALTLTEQAPVAWQITGTQTLPVVAHYEVAADGSIGFALGAYDHSQPLVLDPTLTYSSYLGGTGNEAAIVSVDALGNLYAAGTTDSPNFPTPDPPPGTLYTDAVYVTKFTPDGETLLSTTFFEGNGRDWFSSIAVTAAGQVYLTGQTDSTDFPVYNALQSHNAGGCGVAPTCWDAFITALDTTTSSLIYSTYLGGNGDQASNDIAVDAAGNAYLTGYAHPQSTFPWTHGCPTHLVDEDAFVAKIHSNGTALDYAYCLGGQGGDRGYGIAVDSEGYAYVVGGASENYSGGGPDPHFPQVGYPIQSGFHGGVADAFVAIVDPTGTGLTYSALAGGIGWDDASGVTLDSAGNIYVTGSATAGFPQLNSIYPMRSAYDAFIMKLSPRTSSGGPALIFSSFLGGDGDDWGTAVLADTLNNIYVTGVATVGFPQVDPVQPHFGGWTDGFVVKLDVSSTHPQVRYATYIGGTYRDEAYSLAFNANGDVWVGGVTNSHDFPTVNPYQGQPGTPDYWYIPEDTVYDGFIALIDPPPACTGDELLGAAATCNSAFVGGINTQNGNFWYQGPGLGVSGPGGGLSFVPSYNSQARVPAMPWQRTLGPGWTFSYNMYLTIATGIYYVHMGDGSVLPFPALGSSLTPARLGAQLTYTNSTYTLETTHGHTQYIFDGNQGQLTSIVDRFGYSTALTYDASGYLDYVTEINPAVLTWQQRELDFELDSSNTTTLKKVVLRVPDENERSVSLLKYDENASGAYSYRIEDTTKNFWIFRYDSSSRELRFSAKPFDGNVVSLGKIHYDGIGSPGSVDAHYDTLNRVTTFAYHHPSVNQYQTTVSQPHLTTDYNYTNTWLASTVAHPEGEEAETWSFIPSEDFLTGVKIATDPRGKQWHTTWDAEGNVRAVSDPNGYTTTYDYYPATDGMRANDLHLVTELTTTDDQRFTTYQRNTQGRLESATINAPGLAAVTTSYTYGNTNFPDAPTAITDANQHIWGTEYDPYGYPHLNLRPAVGSEDPAQRTTITAYDAFGQLVWNQTPWAMVGGVEQHHSVHYEYDDAGAVIKVTTYPDPEPAAVSQYIYKGLHQLTYVCDASHSHCGDGLLGPDFNEHYEYWPDGQVQKITDGAGHSIEYSYDGDTALLYQIHDGDGKTTTYDYFNSGRVKQVTIQGLPPTSYTYYKGGLLKTQTDGNGQQTSYDYDNRNQLRQIHYSNRQTHDITYTPYTNGIVATMQDGTGTTHYTYDGLNHLTEVKDGANQTVQYGYDSVGYRTSITYPTTTNLHLRVDYYPDTANRLDHLIIKDGTTDLARSNFAYYDDGQLKQQRPPVGVTTGISSTLGYDGAGQMLGITYDFSSQPSRIFGYGRDANGRLKSARELEQVSNHENGDRHTYSYWGDNRLMQDFAVHMEDGQPQYSGPNIWQYDPAGNLESYHYSTQSGYSGRETQRTWSYNDASELSNSTEILTTTLNLTPTVTTSHWLYDYDDNGNRTNVAAQEPFSHTTQLYGYDQENRLTVYEDGRTNKTTNYGYDGNGLRSWKKTQGLTNQQPDVETRFTWDVAGGLPLLLQEQKKTTPRRAPSTTETTSYIYGPLGVMAEVLPNGAMYYMHTDQQGSVRVLTNSSNTVVANYNYDAYGNPLTTTTGLANSFGYSGEYRDTESGMIYLRARYYDPASQQFITRDSASTLQPYAYGNGSPINGADPTGHFFDTLLDLAFIGGDIADIASNGLSWESGLALGADVVGAAIPFATGGGLAVRGAAHAEEALAHSESTAAHIARSCGPNSFSGETLVATSNGDKPIDSIQIGDHVLAYNEGTDTTGVYTVTAVLVHDDPVLTHLTIDAETLETTPEHPFYTSEAGWIAAGDLWLGAHIRKADGGTGVVQAVSAEQHHQQMYNLTVDVAHTFFVGSGEWLVHNICHSRVLGKNLVKSGIARPPETAAHHIVAWNDVRAKPSQAILAREGIGIDEAANGVFLPIYKTSPNPLGAQVHVEVHSGLYHLEVFNRLNAAGPGNVRAELQMITTELLSATFPH